MAMDDFGSSSSSSSISQTSSTNSFFTPLLMSIMGIGATALAILFYHLLLVRYCMRRHAARMTALRNLAGEEIQTGVDEKTLLTIPIITYKKSDPIIMDQSECAVCLGDVENGDMVRLLPNCKHLFHVKCIDEWFVGHTSCPVCRVPVVGPDDESTRGCPVCNRSGATIVDDRSSFVSYEQDDAAVLEVIDNAGEFTSGPRILLRHCHSLILPGEKKGRLTGMELKRSLSMGQSNCVIIDINNVGNVDKDCTYYSSLRDESIRQFQRVKESITRMCVGVEGQRQGSTGNILPY
uniref:RING-H2 finger protein ATL51-like n=1 Tax=Erigeron canadensis TaxID=72917 RepID=UPI001CB8F266|nr:RING-H2 finger protein ATL51-like [Erigeron canadensis]